MKKETDLPPKFVAKCKAIIAKRARTVIDHILKNGFITTEELKNTYGYNHPPRAIRDVKENGIPIEMFRKEGRDGRSMAAYSFGDPTKVRIGRFSGRTVLGKNLRKALVARDNERCAIYHEYFSAKQLQIDHRIPFEVSGDDSSTDPNPDNYMLLCASANRAKSWSCENCLNWKEIKDPKICARCYWAYPDNYDHVAMKPIRRLDVMWVEKETKDYDKLQKQAKKAGREMPSYVKEILRKIL